MEPCEGVDGIVGPSYGPSLRGRQDSNFLGSRVPILLCIDATFSSQDGDHQGMLRQEEPVEMVRSNINTLNMELQR